MKKKTIIILAILVVLGALVTVAGVKILNTHTANSESVRIEIPTNDFSLLCNLLDQKEVRATTTFHLFARLLKLDQNVRPGSYIVEPHTNTLALVRKLRNGQQDPIRLTIGKFRLPQDLNQYLNGKLMHDDFHVTLDSFYIIRPDTYEFYWTVTPQQFMQRMEKEYNTFWESERLKVNKENNEEGGMRNEELLGSETNSSFLIPHSSLTHDIVVLASIVEEETNNNSEKPLIASVYLNRLSRGMPLQADPTVKYAVGDFTLRRILNKHLAVDSPFNTYLHTGLPPAPICLPSKASVKAVLQAPETNYLYFCASDKMDGTHRFAATLAEHNRNAAAFHRALTAQGIR